MLLIIITFITSLSSYAFDVTSPIKPFSSFTTVATQGACSTFTKEVSTISCNPASFSSNPQEGISFLALGKSEGESVDNAYTLATEKITQEDLERLFEQENYNTAAIDTGILFKTPYFQLGYEPAYVFGSVFLYNPSFPKASLYLVNQSRLTLTSGVHYEFSLYDIYIGGSLHNDERSLINSNFSFSQLGSVSTDELFTKKKIYSTAVDVGLLLYSESLLLPNISFQLKNLNSDHSIDEDLSDSATLMQSFLLFENYSQMGIGKSIQTSFGEFILGYEMYFDKSFSGFYSDYSPISFTYSLGKIRTIYSFSTYLSNLSLYVLSDFADIGISYVSEAGRGSLTEKNEQAVYLSIEVTL